MQIMKTMGMKRTWRFILLGILILVLLALLLAPAVAKRYVVKHSPELIGRRMSVDKVRVYYLTGKFRITDLILYEADQQKDFISFDTLVVDLKPFRLLKHELNLQQLYLSGFSASVIQKDSLFNFSDLIDRLSANGSEVPAAADTVQKEAYRYHLYNIALNNARFEYENRNIDDTLLLRDISFAIPYIGWNQNEKSEAGLRLNLEKEGYLEAGIRVNPAIGDFDMNLALRQIDMEGFTKLLSSYAEIGSLRGIFNTRLQIQGNLKEPEKSQLAGNMDLTDLSLTDTGEKEFFGAGSLRFVMKQFDLEKARYLVDSLILEEPRIYFELKDSTNNFYEILHINPADSADAGQEEVVPDSSSTENRSDVYYAIQSFIMKSGIIDFRDYTTGDPFDYHLSEIAIGTDSIDSSSDRATIYATMLLNERGELTAKTEFNPMSPSNFKLDYTITDFRLNDLNIYSRYYMGFPVLYGEMFYKGHTEVMDGALLSDNHLIMDHVELGEKRGGLMDLPLKFALYILKDRNDVIDLEIPVRGRTDDPQVSVGKIVWNTIKNLIVRTATAPYDFLSGLLGVDPSDIESIEFAYGDTLLTEKIEDQIELLLELEAMKPTLEIELIYFNDPEREQQAILMAETGTDSIGVAALEPKVVEQVAADSLTVLYSQVRIRKIDQTLHALRDSTQIVVLQSDLQDPLNVGSLPRFEVRYSMKDEVLGQ
jgi:hypothetical protein